MLRVLVASLFEHVQWWLRYRRGGPRREPLWRRLRSAGAGRELVRYAEPFGEDAAAAWVECPRPAWLLELALCAGVSRRLVAETVRAVLGDDAGPAAEALVDGGPEEELLEVARELASARVEGREDVQLAVRAARRVRTTRDIDAWGEARNALDRAYAQGQRELADAIRERIRFDEVRLALDGLDAHPYR